MSRTAKRRMICAVPALCALAACAAVLVSSMTLLAAPRPQPPRGDFNLDGVVSTADIAAFVLAVRDPVAWRQTYGADQATLLAVGDFDADGALTIEDVHGFVAAVLATLPGGGHGLRLGEARLARTEPVVDLDIDSDNIGTGLPARDAAEDLIEDDPSRPGKEILSSSQTVYAALEFAATGAAELTGLQFRLTFPQYVSGTGNITIAVPSFYRSSPPPADAPVASGTPTYYPYPYWILGDMNGDEAVNTYDLDPFVLALTDSGNYELTYGMDPWLVGDINGDWGLNTADIDPFVTLITSGETHPIPIRLMVTGRAASDSLGATRIVAEADQDGDAEFEQSELDAVRTTVWDGTNLPRVHQLGAAKSWGAGLAVSPFSIVNLLNGNLITALPLVSWDPVGPPVSFALYHNSQTQAGELGSAFENGGAEVATGWTCSYTSHVVGDYADAVVSVVGADATKTVFALSEGAYLAPPGVHDLLTWDSQQEEWTLTSPDQAKLVFDSAGRLIRVVDAFGNAVIVHRDSAHSYRIDYVASAAEPQLEPEEETNRLALTYDDDGTGKLETVTDPIGRCWVLTCSGSWLLDVEWPHDTDIAEASVTFGYDSTRIGTITDRDNKTWTYDYATSSPYPLTLVQDPTFESSHYQQEFDYPTAFSNGRWTTTYTDRRDYDWVYAFDDAGNAREVSDPMATPGVRSATYDVTHNMLTSTDELNHTWTMTYNDSGRVETISSPISGQTWTYTWEQPDAQTWPNLYRLTAVTDPLEHSTLYTYDTALSPTLVHTVTEPADGQGNGEAVTTMEYYDHSDDYQNVDGASLGQLAWVVDANSVTHVYKYDVYGYLGQELEGLAQWPSRDIIIPSMINPAGPWGGTCPEFTICNNTQNGVGQTTGGRHGSCTFLGVTYNCLGEGEICPEWECSTDSSGYCRRLGSTPAPQLEEIQECFSNPDYDVMGRLNSVTRCAQMGSWDATSYETEYDALGRPSLITKTTAETDPDSDWSVARTFTVDLYDPEGRALQITGQDDQTIEYTFDDDPGYDQLGRPSTVTRGGLSATFTYDAASRLTEVDYGNNTKVVRGYDDANRLTSIEHRGTSNQVLFSIQYVWNLDNTLYSRTEYDATAFTPGVTSVVTFGYDNRARLTGEQRVVGGTSEVYHITYVYDQLGNRLEKYDSVAQRRTCYVYDTDWDADADQWRSGAMCGETLDWTPGTIGDPDLYETHNNRLLEYREYFDDGESKTLLRTVHYTYYETGHVSNITLHDEWLGEGDPPDEYTWYYDLAFYYTSAGKLYQALWGRYQLDGGYVVNYTRQARRQFAYDGYNLVRIRDIDPDSATGDPDYPETETWRDYFGGQVYSDYQVAVAAGDPDYIATVTEQQVYLGGPALAQQDAGGTNTRYKHGDLIDSAMMLTNGSGTALSPVSYTAFGELIYNGTTGGELPSGSPRYGYAGGWGYESGHYQDPPGYSEDPPDYSMPGHSDLLALYGPEPSLPPVTLQHVGYRWYQPEIGRFVQRDPIGILGGFNVYLYASNNPLRTVDPSGQLSVIGGVIGGVAGGLVGGLLGGWRGGIKGAVTGAAGGLVTGGLIGIGCPVPLAGAAGGLVSGAMGGFWGPWAAGAPMGTVALNTAIYACIGAGGGALAGQYGGDVGAELLGGVVSGIAGLYYTAADGTIKAAQSLPPRRFDPILP
jgi:YD repeat-containing protein